MGYSNFIWLLSIFSILVIIFSIRQVSPMFSAVISSVSNSAIEFSFHLFTIQQHRSRESWPPAKPGAWVNPRRALYRQASQEALNDLSLASLALQPVNGLQILKHWLFRELRFIILFLLRSNYFMLKLFYSPQQSWGFLYRWSIQ